MQWPEDQTSYRVRKLKKHKKKKHRNLLHAIPGWLGQNEHVKNDNFYILVQFVVGIRDHYDGTGD